MLEWTGERFLPWIREAVIAYEHLHRYAYASKIAKGKRVLDLACGEGYGSRILAGTATSVVGVDIDENAIAHASAKYGLTNLQFISGSITAVPIHDDRSFDVVVCFEAIEHIEDQDSLLSEVKRLLTPGGVFIVSTPNKAVYHDEPSYENPFHVKELYFEEFRDLLSRYFGNLQFLGQRVHPGSSLWPIGSTTANGFLELVMERGGTEFQFIDVDSRVAKYFIGVATDAAEAPPGLGSFLVDESDALLEEKDREREKQVGEREETIKGLEEAVKWKEGQVREKEDALTWMQQRTDELEKTIASNDEALAWRSQQVNELETAKDYWAKQSESLTGQLQNTQRQLAVATDTLAGIHASRGWKLIMKLRSIRDSLKGLGKSRM
jgi:ubiquinone/menaquinone biosynthesis C-methylase UbiE